MGIEVKGYKLGGSLAADVYVQLGRQPIATQRKNTKMTGDEPDTFVYNTIYVATAHGNKADGDHITVVRQGGITSPQPVTSDLYALAYSDLKKHLTEEGYTFTDSQ